MCVHNMLVMIMIINTNEQIEFECEGREGASEMLKSNGRRMCVSGCVTVRHREGEDASMPSVQ